MVRKPTEDDEDQDEDRDAGGAGLFAVQEDAGVGDAIAQVVHDLTGRGAQRRRPRRTQSGTHQAAVVQRTQRRQHVGVDAIGRRLLLRLRRLLLPLLDDPRSGAVDGLRRAQAVHHQLTGRVRQTGATRPLAVAVCGTVNPHVHPRQQG